MMPLLIGFLKTLLAEWRYFYFNLSKPTAYVMHQQFNIQQLYTLPTLYLRGQFNKKVTNPSCDLSF
jgi:hypothetical protein